jgi:phage baseplate assembly protein W
MTQRIEPLRFDYGFPLRIGPSHRQAELATYPNHVAQMIRQVLLTTPGERVNMPDFGCGLRQLVFQPKTAALDATTELMIRRALETTLGGHISVNAVKVTEPASLGDGAIQIEIQYTLIETRTAERLLLEVS